MTTPLRVGIAGLGTVGASLVRLIDAKQSLLAERCGRPVEVTAVSARDRNRDRGGMKVFDKKERERDGT